MRKRTPIDTWVEPTLQGLAHWIKWKNAYFPDYPLGESALIAEACGLMYARLPETKHLLCEVPYRNLLSESYAGDERADLVIVNSPTSGKRPARSSNLSAVVDTVIEVKRWPGIGLVKNDLQKLSLLRERSHDKSLKLMMILIAQSSRPKNFVTEGGVGESSWIELDHGSTCYNVAVRRVCKSAQAFTKPSMIENASYAVLLELE